MNWNVPDCRENKPIDQQIKDSVKRLIRAGALLSGEPVPSLACLAAGLAVNPRAVARAYRELEQEGWLRVSDDGALLVAEEAGWEKSLKVELMETFDAAARELMGLSVPLRELSAHLEELKGEAI